MHQATEIRKYEYYMESPDVRPQLKEQCWTVNINVVNMLNNISDRTGGFSVVRTEGDSHGGVLAARVSRRRAAGSEARCPPVVERPCRALPAPRCPPRLAPARAVSHVPCSEWTVSCSVTCVLSRFFTVSLTSRIFNL